VPRQIDPVDERRNEKHTKQWITTLERYAFPVLGSVSVSRVWEKTICDLLCPTRWPQQRTAAAYPASHRSLQCCTRRTARVPLAAGRRVHHPNVQDGEVFHRPRSLTPRRACLT
jgi:hypothetical protein